MAAGVTAQLHVWRLPPATLRPSEWLQEAQRSLRSRPSGHRGRVTALAAQGGRVYSAGHDGVLRGRGLLGEEVGEAAPEAASSPVQPRLLAACLLGDSRVACGTDAGSVLVFDGATLQELGRREGLHGGAAVSGVCSLADGRVATVSCARSGFEVFGAP